MYDKLPKDTIEQYEKIMLEFFEALLPKDYQDYIDNDELVDYSDGLPF